MLGAEKAAREAYKCTVNATQRLRNDAGEGFDALFPGAGYLLPLVRIHVPLRYIGFLQVIPEFFCRLCIEFFVSHELAHPLPLDRQFMPLLLKFFQLKVYVEIVRIFHNFRFNRIALLIPGMNSLKITERSSGKKIVRRTQVIGLRIHFVDICEIGRARLHKVMHKRHLDDGAFITLSFTTRDNECQENDAHHVLEITRHRYAEVLYPSPRDIPHRAYLKKKFDVTILSAFHFRQYRRSADSCKRLPGRALYSSLPPFGRLFCRTLHRRAAFLQFGCYLLPILLQLGSGAFYLAAVETTDAFVGARRLFNDGGYRRTVHVLERLRAFDDIPFHVYRPLRCYPAVLFCVLTCIKIVSHRSQSGRCKHTLR